MPGEDGDGFFSPSLTWARSHLRWYPMAQPLQYLLKIPVLASTEAQTKQTLKNELHHST